MKRRKKTNIEKLILKYEIMHKEVICLGILGVIGLIFFWRGIATILDVPFLNKNPAVLVIAGLAIIFFTGALIKR
ncbi:MAG: hypothetical protein V1802_02800 [Candidatus Aenigmatarchaeota archaeon]